MVLFERTSFIGLADIGKIWLLLHPVWIDERGRQKRFVDADELFQIGEGIKVKVGVGSEKVRNFEVLVVIFHPSKLIIINILNHRSPT